MAGMCMHKYTVPNIARHTVVSRSYVEFWFLVARTPKQLIPSPKILLSEYQRGESPPSSLHFAEESLFEHLQPDYELHFLCFEI